MQDRLSLTKVFYKILTLKANILTLNLWLTLKIHLSERRRCDLHMFPAYSVNLRGYTYIRSCPISRGADLCLLLTSPDRDINVTNGDRWHCQDYQSPVDALPRWCERKRQKGLCITGEFGEKGSGATPFAFKAPTWRLRCQHKRKNTSPARQMAIQ